jgi:hypothetical protein
MDVDHGWLSVRGEAPVRLRDQGAFVGYLLGERGDRVDLLLVVEGAGVDAVLLVHDGEDQPGGGASTDDGSDQPGYPYHPR